MKLTGVAKSSGGVELGDVITAIDGKPVKKVNDLFSLLETKKIGDVVQVEILRDGKKQTVEVTLAAVE